VIATGTRQDVLARDDWRSVLRGAVVLGQAPNMHHRKLRSRGGPDTASNLVTLSGSGTTLDHGWVHHGSNITVATKAGLIVNSWHNPLAIPVWLWSKGWCLLDDDGFAWPLEDQDPAPEGLPS